MILSLCTKLMSMLVIVYGCDHPKFGCLIKNFSQIEPFAILKSVSQHGICYFFRYVSDFIWMLCKNNRDK